jgi:hypothetical protein
MAWTWTASSFKTAANVGEYFGKKTSTQFDAIPVAISRYASNGTNLVRLGQLKDILDAVQAWWVWKQEDKHDHTSTTLKIGGANTKIAAKSEDAKGRWRTSFSKREDAIDKLVKSIVQEVDDILAVERTRWGNGVFTDPNDHDQHPNDYRYLITSQTETAVTLEYREKTAKNPDLIKSAVISASVIAHDSVHVWAPSGFILKAPKKCIGVAFKDDIATANAVAFGHAMERYREMLRLYLGQVASAGSGLPRPNDIMPDPGKHNEVMVLGKSYGKETKVTGIFVMVDDESDTVAGITPANCYRILANFTPRGGTAPKQLVEAAPMVTAGRMQIYRDLHVQRGLPIVQIPLGDHVEVPASTLNGLYTSGARYPFVANGMVLHGSNTHRQLEEDTTGNKATKVVLDDTHRCPICVIR